MNSRINLLPVLLGLVLFSTSQAIAADPWREGANRAATALANRIEVLDETLHEAYEQHSSEPFKKAIDVIHHIERIVTELKEDVLTLPFTNLCQDFHHIYEDLVQIRLDLIALGLEGNPSVVKSWNDMVYVYNNQLNPYFYQCPASSHEEPHTDGVTYNALGTL